MKNKLIIGILTIISILSLSYGYYQKDRADKNEIKALENERIAGEMKSQAEESMRLAELQKKRAEENEKEAVMQRILSEEALRKRK